MSDLWLVGLIILGIWTIVCFFDTLFKSCLFHPYLTILENIGISISPGKLKFYTSHFNRLFYMIAKSKPQFFKIWFTIGGIFGVLAIVPSISLLLFAIYNNIGLGGDDGNDQQVIVAIVPGVNLPASQLLYYFIALLLCSVFHELGHAVAAFSEGITIDGVGMFIVGILPSAYVDIATNQLNRISIVHQLRIFCAGIWHNFVLAALAYIILLSLPIVHEPFYAQNVGVLVTSVTTESPVGGVAGLEPGDRITYINECLVENTHDWSTCLVDAFNFRHGYCLPDISVSQAEIVTTGTEPKKSSCCPVDNPSGLCFSHKFNPPEYGCFNARAILDESRGRCNITSKCRNPDFTCVVPKLDNQSTIIVIHREEKDAVIFLGHPAEVFQSVVITNYVPRFSWVSYQFPVIVENILNYIISFSAGLGILNSIPCIFLDGQHITRLTVDYFLASIIVNKEKRSNVSAVIIMGGTILLIFNVVLAVYRIT